MSEKKLSLLFFFGEIGSNFENFFWTFRFSKDLLEFFDAFNSIKCPTKKGMDLLLVIDPKVEQFEQQQVDNLSTNEAELLNALLEKYRTQPLI